MKGFTLIEMVIVVALVIILSLISVPIYKDHVLKAKLAEGYTLLATIRDAQNQYYSEYDNFLYSNITSFSDVLDIDARGNKYFTSFLPGSTTWDGAFCISVYSSCENIAYTYSEKNGPKRLI